MHIRYVVAASALAAVLPLASLSGQSTTSEPPKWSLSLGVDPTRLNLNTPEPGVDARMVANLTRSWQSANSPLARHISLLIGRDAPRQFQPDQTCGCWWRAFNSYSGLTAGASYDLFRASRFTPYLTAGTGVYYTRQSNQPANGQVLVSQLPLLYNDRSGFSLGVNGGLGVKIRIGSHEFFVEEMLHAFDVRRLSNGVYPLSFGLRF
jgi:hypothetical protein